MKKIISLFLAASALYGAGTLTQTMSPQGFTTNQIITITATADSADGSFPATTMLRYNSSVANTDGWSIIAVETDPGSTAPTDNWDLTFIDTSGLDLLNSQCINRDSSATERCSADPIPMYGNVAVTITGNSVNSATITIKVYLVNTTVAKRGGDGGSITTPVSIANGGTGATSFAASKCIQSAADGLSLEAAASACGSGGMAGFEASETSSTVVDITAGVTQVGSQPYSVSATSGTLTQYSATCTAANPMVCTSTADIPASALALNMSVSLLGAACSGVNTLQTLQGYSGSGNRVLTFTYNSTACGSPQSVTMGANGSASGTSYFCSTNAGEVAYIMPSGAGLFLVISGDAITRQATAPACDEGAVGEVGWRTIGTGTLASASNGTWGTVTAWNNTTFQQDALVAGTGITLNTAAGITVVEVDSDVMMESGANSPTGANDFSAASSFLMRAGSSDPATCTTGTSTLFYNTTTKLLKHCSATNTWASVGGSSSITLQPTIASCNGTAGTASLYVNFPSNGAIARCIGGTGAVSLFEDSPTVREFYVSFRWPSGYTTVAVTWQFAHASSSTLGFNVYSACQTTGATMSSGPTWSSATASSNSATGTTLQSLTTTLTPGCAAGDLASVRIRNLATAASSYTDVFGLQLVLN